MNRKIVYLPEAVKDMKSLAGNQRILVAKALKKVSANPLPEAEGGYGKPLGNRNDSMLAGLLKVKLKAAGLRIVYKPIRTDTEMLIIVIGARADDEVHDAAQKRAVKHDLKS